MTSLPLKRLVRRLLLLTVVMFAFGFALVPIYDVMCKAFGINGKTGGQYAGSQVSDPRARYACSSCRPTPATWSGISTPPRTRSRSTRGR